MFPSLLARRVRPARVRTTRLSVEALEYRESPASLDPLTGTTHPLDGITEAVVATAQPVAVTADDTTTPTADASPAPTAETSTTTTQLDSAPATEPTTDPGQPSGEGNLYSYTFGGGDGFNLSPTITSFEAAETTPGVFLFSGTVSDETPAGMVVTFGGGPPSVSGHTCTVLADGTFETIIRLRTDGSDAGTVEAQTTDAGGLESNVATADVAPTITP